MSIINLKNDIIFKIVFGSEKNEKILISLLNSILNLEGFDKIEELTFLNTFNIREYLDEKTTSLDVKVKDGMGQRYNIEVQVSPERDFINRIIYYHDKMYSEQLKSGEAYQTLEKSVSISILNFDLLQNETDYHNIYRYLNIKSKKELTGLKEIHFIELPKFVKDLDKLNSKFEKWVYSIKYSDEYDEKNIPDILKKEEDIIMALSEMQKVSEDERVRELIKSRERARQDEASRMYNAKKSAFIETAINMLKEGFEVKIVSKMTSLTIKEVEEIKKNLK